MTAIEKICAELVELGFSPQRIQIVGCPAELAVVNYGVKIGRYKGDHFNVGIGFQEQGYPEYPPHWLGVAGLPHSQVTVHSSYNHCDVQWLLFSVPPSDFWDKLSSSEKNMKTYINRHVPRFWSQV